MDWIKILPRGLGDTRFVLCSRNVLTGTPLRVRYPGFHNNKMSSLITRARDYASYAHARIKHKRKYTGQPYQVHLKSVVQILGQVTDDENMLAAAWLHDAVEDTEATHHQIEEQFGQDVASLVYQLTDISRPGDGNRAYRKALDRAHLAEASERAQTIKLADLIDNTRDICKHDQKFARVYVQEVAALLEVLQDGDRRLMTQAQKALKKVKTPAVFLFGNEVKGLRLETKKKCKAVIRLGPKSSEPLRASQAAAYALGVIS